MTEDEMVGWHHWIDRHEFEQAPGDGEGQGSWSAAVDGVTKSQTWLSNWITRTKEEIGTSEVPIDITDVTWFPNSPRRE